jgi:anaerobic magnesium-protoporphyrin IX monomethyl ester cyclase
MKRAGCFRVYFGLESGSDEVLRAFGKGGRATLDQAVTAVQAARRAGLEPNGFFLVGLTGDTPETMQDTIDFARSVPLDTMKCGICVPFPGTPMFHQLQEQGRIKTLDWDAYTVYNEAEAIFDHPTLDWDVIRAYFRRFYVQAYFRNPRYLLRRLRYMLRTGEIVWNVWYTLKFMAMVWGPRKAPVKDGYQFEDRWRPTDVEPTAPLRAPIVPRAHRGGGATKRDGTVTVALGRRDRAVSPR